MATSKTYYCSICEREEWTEVRINGELKIGVNLVKLGPFSKKEYFKHCKGEDHKIKKERLGQKMPPSTVKSLVKGQKKAGLTVRLIM